MTSWPSLLPVAFRAWPQEPPSCEARCAASHAHVPCRADCGMAHEHFRSCPAGCDRQHRHVPCRADCGQRHDHRQPRRSRNNPVRRVLVFDTETFADVSQAFMFGFARLADIHWDTGYHKRTGSWRLISPDVSLAHTVRAEVCIHADDLECSYPDGYETLTRWCADNNVPCISRTDFMRDYVRRYCVVRERKGRVIANTTLTGFNLPFDLSRLAYSYGEARGARKGEFVFDMFPGVPACEPGCTRKHKHRARPMVSRYRPKLYIRHLDSKKSIISWGMSDDIGRDFARTGEYRGQFLDLHQLVWGLTNTSMSLDRACKAFSLPAGAAKTSAEEYGKITPGFIEYARQDVKATAMLCVTVLAEYMKHPVDLQASKVFSPASIGKAYLRKMGITPLRERGGVPSDPAIMGRCVSAFYGGRAEAHIRRVPVPVTVMDFTSMYSTVNTLMGLWDHVNASRISVTEDASELARFRAVAEQVAAGGTEPLFDRSLWPSLTGFAQVMPSGDVLPVRARYNDDTWNAGISEFRCPFPVWYTYADVLASALATGRVPDIRRVMRFTPGQEKIAGLRPVTFPGIAAPVDPARTDFFKTVIEQRQAIKNNQSQSPERDRVTGFLKVLANSTSYGIYVEMLRHDTEPAGEATIYGLTGEPWTCKPNAAETAQEFCYPPVGAAITGAARLMLAIFERLISDAGGSWLFCDTDSMAVVTTKTGELIPCPGGTQTMPDGTPAIQSLTREQVRQIQQTVDRLNPYDRRKVPGSLLKDETGKTNEHTQVWGYAISAKRYCLFTYDNGRPVVPDSIDGKDAFTQHGLGMYLDPSRPGRPGTGWIREAWQHIISQAHGETAGEPAYADVPAVSQVTVSTPAVMRSFRDWNRGKPYDAAVKPFSFVILATETGRLTLPNPDNPQTPRLRRLLTPFTASPDDWLTQDWHVLYEPGTEPVRLTGVQVKTMRNVLAAYGLHPEAKQAMPDGQPCTPGYAGLLTRQAVCPAVTAAGTPAVFHIGKESNKLESGNESATALITSADQVYTTYYHDDRSVIRQAFAGMPDREIARLINARTARIGAISYAADYPPNVNPDFLAEANRTRNRILFGEPATVDHKLIARYFRGGTIRNEAHQTAITATAAETVAAQVGIDPDLVCWQGRRGTYTPETVLGMWLAGHCQDLPSDAIHQHAQAIAGIGDRRRRDKSLETLTELH